MEKKKFQRDIFDIGIPFYTLLAAIASGIFSGGLIFWITDRQLPEEWRWPIAFGVGFVFSVAFIQNERHPTPDPIARIFFRGVTICGAAIMAYAGIESSRLEARITEADLKRYESAVESSDDNFQQGYLTATTNALEASRARLGSNPKMNIAAFFDFVEVETGIKSRWLQILFAVVLGFATDSALRVLAIAKERISGLLKKKRNPEVKTGSEKPETGSSKKPDTVPGKKTGNRSLVSARLRARILKAIRNPDADMVKKNGRINCEAVARRLNTNAKSVRIVAREEGIA